MTFTSTRATPGAPDAPDTSRTAPVMPPATFREAIFRGLAPDGGLYHPTLIPDMRNLFEGFRDDIEFKELAAEVTLNLLSPELDRPSVLRIIDTAYDFSPVIRYLERGLSLLELYHGPSYAFKDFGACFLAACMGEFLNNEKRRSVILVATSGDTGSAVANAFYGKENISVVILYPSGRVSPLQEKQLTTLGGNITALEIRGSFDDCQAMVKEAFADSELCHTMGLTSANSINLGRLIPQSFYYIYAYTRLRERLKDGLIFCVPSGNFGNLTAGVYAWQWGLPVKAFIATTNINDVVPQYIKSGIFSPRKSVETISNAMDVGNPSNFERLTAIFSASHGKMKELINAYTVTDDTTRRAMEEFLSRYGFLIDPHTAVGYEGALRFRHENGKANAEIVILGTAHPAKFPETVKEATGKPPELPDGIQESLLKPKKSTLLDNNTAALKTFLLASFS